MKRYLIQLYKLIILIFIFFNVCTTAPADTDKSLDSFVNQIKNYSPTTKRILNSSDKYQVQILYTNIVRKNGCILFTPYEYRLDNAKYFYPASSIKLSSALLALEKMEPYGGTTSSDVLKNLSSRNYQYSTSGNLRNYIRNMLVVSDNNAYNRLYEFIGQEEYKDSMERLGFTDTVITHRFLEGSGKYYSEFQNRYCNRSQVYRSGKLLFEEEEKESNLSQYAPPQKKVIENNRNFTNKNKTSIVDLQKMMKLSIFYPYMKNNTTYRISDTDLDFLQTCLKGGNNKSYKYFICGGRNRIPKHLSIYNKIGNAYGYLIDNAYIVDHNTGKEFLLTAVIYTGGYAPNYNYYSVGMPFLRDLGNAVLKFNNS